MVVSRCRCIVVTWFGMCVVGGSWWWWMFKVVTLSGRWCVEGVVNGWRWIKGRERCRLRAFWTR